MLSPPQFASRSRLRTRRRAFRSAVLRGCRPLHPGGSPLRGRTPAASWVPPMPPSTPRRLSAPSSVLGMTTNQSDDDSSRSVVAMSPKYVAFGARARVLSVQSCTSTEGVNSVPAAGRFRGLGRRGRRRGGRRRPSWRRRARGSPPARERHPASRTSAERRTSAGRTRMSGSYCRGSSIRAERSAGRRFSRSPVSPARLRGHPLPSSSASGDRGVVPRNGGRFSRKGRTMTLSGSRVAFLATDGFEDSELTSPWECSDGGRRERDHDRPGRCSHHRQERT